MAWQTDTCEICGKHLITRNTEHSNQELTCYFCHESFNALISCPEGHYICDTCHSKKGKDFMLDYCLNTEETDPYVLADMLLQHPSMNMYGPEHHILVPLVLLTVLKNQEIPKPDGQPIIESDLQKAVQRASKIPGGWCGFYGSCGAAMGAGVAISVFTNANPSKSKERTWANQTVSRGLSLIADELQHCCKRSVKIALKVGMETIKKILHHPVKLGTLNPCQFSGTNPHCEFQNCPYFLN